MCQEEKFRTFHVRVPMHQRQFDYSQPRFLQAFGRPCMTIACVTLFAGERRSQSWRRRIDKRAALASRLPGQDDYPAYLGYSGNRAKQHFGSEPHQCDGIPRTEGDAAGAFEDIERCSAHIGGISDLAMCPVVWIHAIVVSALRQDRNPIGVNMTVGVDQSSDTPVCRESLGIFLSLIHI